MSFVYDDNWKGHPLANVVAYRVVRPGTKGDFGMGHPSAGEVGDVHIQVHEAWAKGSTESNLFDWKHGWRQCLATTSPETAEREGVALVERVP